MTIRVKDNKDLLEKLLKSNKDISGVRQKENTIEIFTKINSESNASLPKDIVIDGKRINVQVKRLDFNLTAGCITQKNSGVFSILSGGCSVESWSPDGSAPLMTLAGVFRDSLDGNLVGLTVSHGIRKYEVLTVDAIDTATQSQFLKPLWEGIPFVPFFFVNIFAVEQFIRNDEFYGYTINRTQKVEEYDVCSINIYQAPPSLPPSNTDDSPFCIGKIKRANALAPYGADINSFFINKLDVAVIDLNGRKINKTSKFTANMPSTIRPNTIQFMTKAELVELTEFLSDGANQTDERFNEHRIFYSGAESGPQGKDATLCFYKMYEFFDYLINQTTVSFPVPLPKPFDEYIYVYANVGTFYRELELESQSVRTQEPIVVEGDSGSLLWVKPLNTNEWKVAGIIIGSVATEVDPFFSPTLADGTKQTIRYGAAYLPMYYIAEKFKIEPWNDNSLNINTNRPHGVVLDEGIPFSRFIEDFENFTAYEENVENLNIDGSIGFYSGPARVDYRNSLDYKYT